MSILKWAKEEIEIAKKRERGDAPETGWDYGCACYDSALKAFESLCEDGHSGMSIQLTKKILDRLIDGKCLTPIEDTDDVWNHVGKNDWQCKRYSALFKTKNRNGEYSYTDNNRSVMQLDDGTKWHNGIVTRYVHERFPIEFPYMPMEKPYKVICEQFYYKHPDAVGEYDHMAMLTLVYPNGEEEIIDKYYAETEDGMKEISQEEYLQHKKETFE